MIPFFRKLIFAEISAKIMIPKNTTNCKYHSLLFVYSENRQIPGTAVRPGDS